LAYNLAVGITDISCQLERFWKIKELPTKSSLSPEKQAKNILWKTPNGTTAKIIVCIFFQTFTDNLESRELAERHLKTLERIL